MNPDGMAHFCISSPPITFLYSHNYLFISTLFPLFFSYTTKSSMKWPKIKPPFLFK